MLVNPMVVDGQIYGGLAQGIGTALYEEMPFDAAGQPLASTLPTICCRARPRCRRRASTIWRRRRPIREFGVKGIGEGGAIAPPAAIANAVNDALRPLGAEMTAFADDAAPHRRGGARGSAAKRPARMKPAPFDYERPRDLQAALSLLVAGDGSAKIIAGGQSLGPMLNLRLVAARPARRHHGIAELKQAERARRRRWCSAPASPMPISRTAACPT